MQKCYTTSQISILPFLPGLETGSGRVVKTGETIISLATWGYVRYKHLEPQTKHFLLETLTPITSYSDENVGKVTKFSRSLEQSTILSDGFSTHL